MLPFECPDVNAEACLICIAPPFQCNGNRICYNYQEGPDPWVSVQMDRWYLRVKTLCG